MFWETFYDLCIQRGKKPNPLCKELDISSATVSKWKMQNVIPNGENLLKLGNALNCSVDYLLGRTDIVEVAARALEPLPEDEEKLLDRYRQCDEDGKIAILGFAIATLRGINEGSGETADVGQRLA